MSPNVTTLAPLMSFDVAKYTWLDLHDVPDMPHEERRAKFLARGLEPSTQYSFRDLRLPFDRFVVVPPKYDFGEGGVMTIDRTPDRMVIKGWQRGVKDPTFTAVCTSPDDGSANDIMNVSFDHRLKVAQFSKEKARDAYLDMVQAIISHVLCFTAGIYGEEHNMYKATPNPANPKRIRRNKLPLYDWHTVVVQTTHVPSSGHRGGTHATPRQHDVRGHWAKSKLGKVYWRKSHKRGDASKGIIFHDYVARAV